MGEAHGRRPDGFHLANSPVAVAAMDLDGRTLVQRTSAGTQGVVAARDAQRLFAASLVCASATAAAVSAVGGGAPTYVITGRLPDDPGRGDDDLATARFIDGIRTGAGVDVDATKRAVGLSRSAEATRSLEAVDAHPDDVAFALDIDRFDFAMMAERVAGGIRLVRRSP